MDDQTPEPAPVGDADEVERLRAERDALAQEVQALRHRPPERGRRVAVGILVVVSWIALALAPVAVWARAQVLETDRWVAVAAPLSREPAVQAALADWATAQLAGLVQPERILERALPDRADVLAAPLAGAIEGFVHDHVADYLATDEFSELWEDAVVRAHTAALRLLEGDAPNVEAGATSVTINLLPLLQRVLDRITSATPELFGRQISLPAVDLERIPPGTAQRLGEAMGVEVPDDLGQITVYDRGRLRAAQDALRILGRLVSLVVLVAVVAPLTALWLSRHRRRTALQVVTGALIGVVLARGALLLFADRITGRIARAPARGVAERLGDRLLAPFLDGTGVIVTIGVVLLVVLYLTGGSSGAVRARSWAAATGRRAAAAAQGMRGVGAGTHPGP